jgi:tetratricopeptide (TPR) repeat protein
MRTVLLCSLVLCSAVLFAQPAQPNAAQQAYDAALSAAKAGQLDSAWTGVERALVLNPQHAKALKLRGDLHQRKGESEAALADYKASEDVDPNNARLYISRSALRISQGLHKVALKDCLRAIELDPTDPDGFYNRACALYLGGNIDGAKKDAEKAVKLKPDHADALYLSGVTKGELYEEEAGMADIDAALRLKPTIPGGLMSMAVLLYEGKRYEEAIDKFTEVLATDTSETGAAYYYRGDCWYNLENKEKACADFLESVRLGDKDALFIKKNYCDTELTKIPKKPVKKKRRTTVEF